MGKQIALNILYNIGIFICLALIYSGFEKQRYEWFLGALFIGVIIVLMKIRLVKQVKEQQHKR